MSSWSEADITYVKETSDAINTGSEAAVETLQEILNWLRQQNGLLNDILATLRRSR